MIGGVAALPAIRPRTNGEASPSEPLITVRPARRPTGGLAEARQTRAAVRRPRRECVFRPRQLVCFGGASLGPGGAALNEYALSIARGRRPRICLLVPARGERGGEGEDRLADLYRGFSDARCELSHFFPPRRQREDQDLHAHLRRQDVIYVAGGDLVRLLGGWRASGIDAVLSQAWRNGTVLCGFGAGGVCWFAEAPTSIDGRARTVRGLGLLPWSGFALHGAEGAQRVAHRSSLLAHTRLGYAAEEGVGLHFVGARLEVAVASQADRRAYRVEAREGRLVETPLPTTPLKAVTR
ncbi:MAG: peptidase E [Solirubrobacterales bacterium]|nr:peptidase E [Solirubrobacterales bacterium]